MKILPSIKKNKGMTYVELIVVLSIFSVMLAIALFNYNKFGAKVNIKNLSNDIALKLVEAQKSALSGKLTTSAFSNKPAYGVHFNNSIPKFIYFADLNNTNICDNSGTRCTPATYSIGGEVKDVISITKGNSISNIIVSGTGGGCPANPNSLTVVFTRPSSTPVINTIPPVGGGCTVIYYGINITSPGSQAVTSQIRVYPSGRIQIN